MSHRARRTTTRRRLAEVEALRPGLPPGAYWVGRWMAEHADEHGLVAVDTDAMTADLVKTGVLSFDADGRALWASAC